MDFCVTVPDFKVHIWIRTCRCCKECSSTIFSTWEPPGETCSQSLWRFVHDHRWWGGSAVFPIFVSLWSTFDRTSLPPKGFHRVVLCRAIAHIPGRLWVFDLVFNSIWCFIPMWCLSLFFNKLVGLLNLNPWRLVGHGRQWPNFQMIPQL